MYSAIVFTVRQVEATGVLPQKIAPVSSRQDQAQPLTARWDLLCSPSKHTVTLAEQCSGSRRVVALTVLRRAGCQIWESSCQIRAWASADGERIYHLPPSPIPFITVTWPEQSRALADCCSVEFTVRRRACSHMQEILPDSSFALWPAALPSLASIMILCRSCEASSPSDAW